MKNHILSIAIRSILKEGNNAQRTIIQTYNYDFKNNKHGDMYELGVIDPFLVVKTALENAVSAASLLLTNECLIIKMD